MIWQPGAQYLHPRLPDHEKYRVTPRPPRRKQRSVTNFLARYHATCAVAASHSGSQPVGRPGSRRQVRAPDRWLGGERGPSAKPVGAQVEYRAKPTGTPGRTGCDAGTEQAETPGQNRRGCRDRTGADTGTEQAPG